MKNCTPLWREAHFQVKMSKTTFLHHFLKLGCPKMARDCGAKHIFKRKCPNHLLKLGCPKMARDVAPSAFPSQNAKNTSATDRFLKLGCRKMAQDLVARSTFPSQATREENIGECTANQALKKQPLAWHLEDKKDSRRAEFFCDCVCVCVCVQVKHAKHPRRGALFEVQISKNWHEGPFPSQTVQNTSGVERFFKFRCRKKARRSGAKHISKSKCAKHLRFGAFLEVLMSQRCPTEEIGRLILS